MFSDLATEFQSLAETDVLPSQKVTEINLFIKQMKGLQKDIKFQWVLSHCGVVGNEVADYVARKVQQSAIHLHLNCHFIVPNLE